MATTTAYGDSNGVMPETGQQCEPKEVYSRKTDKGGKVHASDMPINIRTLKEMCAEFYRLNGRKPTKWYSTGTRGLKAIVLTGCPCGVVGLDIIPEQPRNYVE